MSAETRVFFEPKIPLHDPDLYAFERIEAGVPAAEAAASLGRYREDGFLMVRGLLPKSEVLAARRDLEAMARVDRPGCQMIWYEGALRDHLALDPGRWRARAAAWPARRPRACPPWTRSCAPVMCGNSWASSSARQDAAGSPRSPRCALVERLVGNAPALFQDMALVKPAQGRKKRWHQDHAFFNVALDTPTVGVWIPMGAVTPENGCMHLLAGGHKAGARILFKRRDFCLRAWPTPLSTASVT